MFTVRMGIPEMEEFWDNLEITELTARYGHKVWTSYMENRKPAAGRIYWAYGPGRGDITIVAIEPHPDDKSNAYKKITLSAMGEVMK